MRIAHLADIQIRNFSRHSEYRQSFENLYASLREKKPDRIVIVGDIAHTKTQISPEFVDMCSELFRSLSEIAPLDLTLGNHDGNLKNPSRMDAISPIVKNLNNPRISLYKKSGLYKVDDNVNYAVFSCFGSEEEWLPFETLEEHHRSKINIALFHGTIDGIKLENDFALASPYKMEMFKGYDYVMLGDIHKTMVLDEDCRVGYPGSYPQQSYGELVQKGYYLWDIESKEKHELDFIELPNVCPFYTITLDDTLSIPQLDLQKNARIRILSRQLTPVEEKLIKDELEKRWSPTEIKCVDLVNISEQTVRTVSKVKIDNLRNTSVQENLIREFLQPQNLSEDTLQRIFQLNKKLNAHIENEDDTLRNVRYKFKSLKFSNLFSFGPDNAMEYSKMSGINGVFGRNGVGKSSIAVDVLLYCLFNKISKEVTKNNLYINEHQEACDAEAQIEIGSDLYTVSRKTSLYLTGQRSGNVKEQGKTDLSFKVLRSNGEIEDFTGLERSDTDKEIRKVFGTAEDFVITTVAPQFELISFLKSKPTERKKTIGRYFDLDLFEKKYTLVNDELKGLKKQIRDFEGRNFDLLIEECQAKTEADLALRQEINDKHEANRKAEEDVKKRIWDSESRLNAIRIATVTPQESGLLREYRVKKSALDSTIKNKSKKLETFKTYACIKNPDCCMKLEEASVKEELEKAQGLIDIFDQKISKLEAAQKEVVVEISNEERQLRTELEILRVKSKELFKAGADLRMKLNEINANIGAHVAERKQLVAEKEEFEKVRQEFDVYHYFSKAMGKDGISYNIIAQNLHIINSEIKKILAGAVGFDIFLEQDEDKEVNIYFKHDRSKKRFIELCSGMEKTIAALAIRAALMSVTTLPVSNIIVFDEIFDSLDSDNLDAMNKILQNLKRLFEVIIVITHNDAVKDICDNVLFIERGNDGVSRVN